MSSLVWVEIDGKAPEHNLKEMRKGSAPGTKACAVIKSNAYGHGVAQVASLLPSAEWFGVNSLEEGLELRSLGVTRPILLLGHVPLAELSAAIEADLALTIYNRETIRAIAALGSLPHLARVHIKVDTGTGRQGVLPEEVEEFTRLVKGNPRLSLEGLSTHFANIEDTLNHDYAQLQIQRFESALKCAEAIAGQAPLRAHGVHRRYAPLPLNAFHHAAHGHRALRPVAVTGDLHLRPGERDTRGFPYRLSHGRRRSFRSRPFPRGATWATAVRIERRAGPGSGSFPSATPTATTGRWETARTSLCAAAARRSSAGFA